MPVNTLLHVISFTLLLTLTVSVSHPPEYSPSPSPSPLSSPFSGSDDPISSPPPLTGSPPAPPPSDLTDSKTLDEHSPSPAPAPTTVSDVSAEVKSEEPKKSSAGGMSTGKKVGVTFGLIAAVSCVIFAGVLYRKRQRNIRRAQYSQSARLEFF